MTANNRKVFDRVAALVEENSAMLIQALQGQAERFDGAHANAKALYQAGQDDPAVMAEQNSEGSLVTNDGYRLLAELYEERAAKARELAQTLRELLVGKE